MEQKTSAKLKLRDNKQHQWSQEKFPKSKHSKPKSSTVKFVEIKEKNIIKNIEPIDSNND